MGRGYLVHLFGRYHYHFYLALKRSQLISVRINLVKYKYVNIKIAMISMLNVGSVTPNYRKHDKKDFIRFEWFAVLELYYYYNSKFENLK